jgi:hypothetical protein
MKVLQSLARALAGEPPPHAPPRVDAHDISKGLDLDSRQEAALRLMDPDCMGYVLLTVHHDADRAESGRIDLIAAMKPGWWPAVAVTLERIVQAVRGRSTPTP